MHKLLTKLLQKRNLDVQTMSVEEKETFDSWDKTLSKRELTLEDLKKFMEQQVGLIETKWRDYELDENKKTKLIAYHTVYKTLLAAIMSPELERSALEQYLLQQIQ